MNAQQEKWLLNAIAARVGDDKYLDQGEEQGLKQDAANQGIDIPELELILRGQLERLEAVSERELVEKLRRGLEQYTMNDKRLDREEERKVKNSVVVPEAGKLKGLDETVAERIITDYCRARNIKRDSESRVPVKAIIVSAAVVGTVFSALILLRPAPPPQVETKVIKEVVVETKVVDPTEIALNDQEKTEIDDLLLRTDRSIAASEFTDPPERCAKGFIDRIRQIDPKGKHRGAEVTQRLEKIVDYYIGLAKRDAARQDIQSATKWLERSKLLGVSRESIRDAERSLGLLPAER